MNITVEVNETELKRLVVSHIAQYFNTDEFSIFDPDKVIIQVKSKQNYNSEWETAAFRARYTTV
jgi:hypothetical protein